MNPETSSTNMYVLFHQNQSQPTCSPEALGTVPSIDRGKQRIEEIITEEYAEESSEITWNETLTDVSQSRALFYEHTDSDVFYITPLNVMEDTISANLHEQIIDVDGDIQLTIYFDGASRGNPGEAAAGFIIEHQGNELIEDCAVLGHTTNNKAEYMALILALERVQEKYGLNNTVLTIYGDSELIMKQLRGEYNCSSSLRRLYQKASMLLSDTSEYYLHHISREENIQADQLANAAFERADTQETTSV